MKLENYLDYLVEFLQDSVKKAHAKGLIVAISGGIDSAVVAMLAKKAFPENHLTLWLPINSSKLDWDCVNELISSGELKTSTIDLEPVLHANLKAVGKTIQPNELISANLKARLRMSSIYAVGQANNYLVVGTDNWDEWYTGYFTKYGDGGVDLAPLVHLLKGEVKQAAKILGVPEMIIDRQPTAGLWEGQTDEAELGFSYAEIDDYLLNKTSSNTALVDRIETLHKNSHHKRNHAIQPKIYSRD